MLPSIIKGNCRITVLSLIRYNHNQRKAPNRFKFSVRAIQFKQLWEIFSSRPHYVRFHINLSGILGVKILWWISSFLMILSLISLWCAISTLSGKHRFWIALLGWISWYSLARQYPEIIFSNTLHAPLGYKGYNS